MNYCMHNVTKASDFSSVILALIVALVSMLNANGALADYDAITCNWARVVLSQRLTNYTSNGKVHIQIAGFENDPWRNIHYAFIVLRSAGNVKDSNLCVPYFHHEDSTIRRKAMFVYIALRSNENLQQWLDALSEREDKGAWWLALYRNGWSEAYFTEENVFNLMHDADIFIREQAAVLIKERRLQPNVVDPKSVNK